MIIAPGADEAAKAVIAKKKNLRLLLTEGLPDPSEPGLALKALAGGYLVQTHGTMAASAPTTSRS